MVIEVESFGVSVFYCLLYIFEGAELKSEVLQQIWFSKYEKY